MFRVDYFIFIFPHILILQLCNWRLVWRLLTDRLTVTWICTLQCVAMAIDGTTKMRKHSIVDRFRVSTKIGAPGSETMPCEIICLLRHATVHIACGLTRSYKTYITPVGWVVDFQVSSSFAVSTSTLSHYWQNWYCRHDITGLASRAVLMAAAWEKMPTQWVGTHWCWSAQLYSSRRRAVLATRQYQATWVIERLVGRNKVQSYCHCM